jgi:segregation and condensation protein B
MEKIKAVIEALIFASDVPLGLEKIRTVFPDVEKTEIKEIIDQLTAEYHERQGGIDLQEVAGGFQFRTNPELSSWIKKLKTSKPHSLSPQAMETLAIVAYRQPIVKSEIEDIRGVDVGGQLKGLMEKKLIRIVGRKDVPGKPIIYGTTKKFLEVFNLKDIMDLPNIRELKELHKQPEPMQQVLLEDEILESEQEDQIVREPELNAEQASEKPEAKEEINRETELEPEKEEVKAEETETQLETDEKETKAEATEPEDVSGKIEEQAVETSLEQEPEEREMKAEEASPEKEIAEDKSADGSES